MRQHHWILLPGRELTPQLLMTEKCTTQLEGEFKMDYPLIWWLMPAVIIPEDTRVWILEHTPCWLGGYCH
jgi:hypothetical protein